jgi:hypothetical protein
VDITAITALFTQGSVLVVVGSVRPAKALASGRDSRPVNCFPQALKAKIEDGLRNRHATGRLIRSKATQGDEVVFLIHSDQWQQRAIGALVPSCRFAAGHGVFI